MSKDSIDDKIKRINDLYHLSQQRELTEDEKREQKELRTAYINSVKANLRGQLENINIQNEDGSITSLSKKEKG